jgi:hypothetical protein
MAIAPTHVESGIRFLEDEESRAFFDAQAHRLMGISGEDFIRRYDAGEYEDTPDDPQHHGITELVMLLPFGR